MYKEDNKDDDDRIIMNTPIYVLISAVVAGLIFVGYQQWIYQPVDLQALAQQMDRELPIPHQTTQYRLEPIGNDRQNIVAKQYLRLEQGITLPPEIRAENQQIFEQVFCQVVVSKVGLVQQMQKEKRSFLVKYYNAKGVMLETSTIQPQACLT